MAKTELNDINDATLRDGKREDILTLLYKKNNNNWQMTILSLFCITIIPIIFITEKKKKKE